MSICNKCCKGYKSGDLIIKCCGCGIGSIHLGCINYGACCGCFKPYSGAMRSAISDALKKVKPYRNSTGFLNIPKDKASLLKESHRVIQELCIKETKKSKAARIATQLKIMQIINDDDLNAAKEEEESFWNDAIETMEGNKVEKRMEFKKCLDNLTLRLDQLLELKELMYE